MVRGTAALVVLVVVGFVVPRWWCGREAAAWLDGDPDVRLALATTVAAAALDGPRAEDFATGSKRFDGEWATVTCTMTVLGLGQLVLDDPSARERWMPGIESCLDQLVDPATRGFGTEAWRGDDPEAGRAYLGYINLALSMHRLLEPNSRFTAENDRLTAAFLRRMSEPVHALHTYPGEAYPTDMAAVVASIGLHHQATGRRPDAPVRDWLARYRAEAIDADTGLVHQALSPVDGHPTDLPRGSGTALAAYFLAFVDPALAQDLWVALRRQLRTFAGFGGIREYPPGVGGGLGDIDSGPVVLGMGVSASGFALAGARLFDDRYAFTTLYRTAWLAGVPVDTGDGRTWLAGGPLGNAILLAVCTARWPS